MTMKDGTSYGLSAYKRDNYLFYKYTESVDCHIHLPSIESNIVLLVRVDAAPLNSETIYTNTAQLRWIPCSLSHAYHLPFLWRIGISIRSVRLSFETYTINGGIGCKKGRLLLKSSNISALTGLACARVPVQIPSPFRPSFMTMAALVKVPHRRQQRCKRLSISIHKTPSRVFVQLLAWYTSHARSRPQAA